MIRTISVLAAGATLVLSAAPADAQNIPLQAAKDSAAQVGRYFSQSRACNWANSIVGNANGSLYGFVYATALAEHGKPAADTVVMGSPPAKPCGSAEDKADQNAAAQVAFEWLTRLASATEHNAQPDWRKGLLELPPEALAGEAYRQSLEKQYLAAIGEAKLKEYYAQIGQETLNEMGFLCASRKDNAKTPRKCPEIPASTAHFVPIATARMKAVEDLAFKLARDHRDAAMGAFGTAFRAHNPTDTSADPFDPCKPGDVVIYPQAPDTQKVGANIEMTLRRYKQQGSAGRVVVKPDSTNGYTLVDGSKAQNTPELRTTLYAIEFQMCGN